MVSDLSCEKLSEYLAFSPVIPDHLRRALLLNWFSNKIYGSCFYFSIELS